MLETGSHRWFDLSIEPPGILLVTFNRPEMLNGMRSATKRDLVEVMAQAQMDDRIRVVLFTGKGRAFCAGDDISRDEAGHGNYPKAEDGLVPGIPGGHANGPSTVSGLQWISQELTRAIRRLDKLTIAAINGVTIQSGLTLALACDFRIAAESARLGSATLRFGLLPDEGGHYLLIQTIGLPRTMDFLMRKRIVTAAEAEAIGLVHEVVPDSALMDHARALATELAEGPQGAMRMLKRSLYRAAETGLDAALEDIATRTGITDHLSDPREGVMAYAEKRKPVFNAWLDKKKG